MTRPRYLFTSRRAAQRARLGVLLLLLFLAYCAALGYVVAHATS